MRLRNLIPIKAKLQLYKVAVLSYLTCCHLVWHLSRASDSRKLERPEERNLRVAYTEKQANYYSGFRRRARGIKFKPLFVAKSGGHGPRRSMRRPRKLGTKTRHCSLVRECGVLQRKPWQVTRLIRSSHIQRCLFFFGKGRSSNYILESQSGNLILETFS